MLLLWCTGVLTKSRADSPTCIPGISFQTLSKSGECSSKLFHGVERAQHRQRYGPNRFSPALAEPRYRSRSSNLRRYALEIASKITRRSSIELHALLFCRISTFRSVSRHTRDSSTRLREIESLRALPARRDEKTSSTAFQRRKETLFERLQQRRRKISRKTEAISPPRGPSPRNSADSHLYGRRNTKFVLLEKTKVVVWIFACGTHWLAWLRFRIVARSLALLRHMAFYEKWKND